jgi:allophanate hydrolase
MSLSETIAALYDRIESAPLHPVWISLVSREASLERARRLEEDSSAATLALYGRPFAIKDNIDLAGIPTTAGCPAYAYSPRKDATVVSRLIAAGAIPIGKTNLDQFATGLVGTRSPYGACSSVFDRRYISGGSSAGSAVAVAAGLAAFSLGTDTAGSGRVPAAFNGLVGLKPTRGLLSMTGVVPACRSLDCVSFFARTCGEAFEVLKSARGYDPLDAYSRVPGPGLPCTAGGLAAGAFRFGVPPAAQLEFFGDDEAAQLYTGAITELQAIGGERVEIDFGIFRDAANLLYSGPWVAERLAAIGPFIETHAGDMDPVVRGIIQSASRFSAVDTFRAMYRLQELSRAAAAEWARMDVLALPTTGTIYTHEAIAADPIKLNTNLGYYTNFVNLLDLAAVAIPAGLRTNGLPFGISLIGPAFTDEALLALGHRFLQPQEPVMAAHAPGCIRLAVVGAHLTGQPLNGQLTAIGARLAATCRTAPEYRLYALSGSMPTKPGLVREPGFQGPGIEVEVWNIPDAQFGGFVAAVPPPLGIGNATLESGEVVKCFICEPYAVADAREITQFGGWRGYLESKALASKR